MYKTREINSSIIEIEICRVLKIDRRERERERECTLRCAHLKHFIRWRNRIDRRDSGNVHFSVSRKGRKSRTQISDPARNELRWHLMKVCRPLPRLYGERIKRGAFFASPRESSASAWEKAHSFRRAVSRSDVTARSGAEREARLIAGLSRSSRKAAKRLPGTTGWTGLSVEFLEFLREKVKAAGTIG